MDCKQPSGILYLLLWSGALSRSPTVMGATSLIPLLMSVALLSRTALDMTRSVNNKRREDSRDRSHRQPAAGSWGDRIVQGRHFSDHQVNLADFYRQEAKRQLLPFHAAKLIKSRELFIDDDDDDDKDAGKEKDLDDYHDQIAIETENIMESIVEAPESFKMKIAKEENSFEKLDEKLDEDFQVPDQLTILEDQIAMESLNKHLKKITQLPSGLKQKVESDLIRKLTTVEPKPKILTGSGGLGGLITGAPDIFIKHKGTPSSDFDFEPRLDPQEWNKHFNKKKSLRFALKNSGDDQSEQIKPETREVEAWDPLRSSGPDKPSLKQFLKKYSSSTVDPMDLIRKYKKRTTSLPVITRKYPTKYFVGKLADKEEADYIYSKYTTASSFRNKNTNTTKIPVASKEIKPDQKYFNADSIRIKALSFSSGGKSGNSKEKIFTPGGLKNYNGPKAFHTTLVPVRLHKVSVGPTTMIHLDHYYNGLQEVNQNDYYDTKKDIKRRKFSNEPEKSKSFGQSLKDLFFPDKKSNRRIIKIKKQQLETFTTTLKPFFTTLSTLKEKLSYSKYNQDIDKISSQSFPYVFQRPIGAPSSRNVEYDEFPRSSLGKTQIDISENIDKSIDKQLVSPDDPDVDFKGMLSTVLPVLMTLGTGLGIALHTILTNWTNYINIGQIPSLKLDKNGVSIAYESSRDGAGGGDLIPINIDDQDNINLGLPDGRKTAFSFKDPELVDIIINLLPDSLKQRVKNHVLKMDKFVLLRVLLTYLSDLK